MPPSTTSHLARRPYGPAPRMAGILGSSTKTVRSGQCVCRLSSAFRQCSDKAVSKRLKTLVRLTPKELPGGLGKVLHDKTPCLRE